MIFSSISFLYFFLPAVLAVYAIAPKRLKNLTLLCASLLFYAVGEPVYVLLLLFSSLSDYLHSLYIQSHRGTRGAKIALISSVVINLGLLGFFKYADFLIGSVNALLGVQIPLTGVSLPIGISFFTFQTLSYTVDVYRGRVQAQCSLTTFATFVCLFPQLIAGPIVRYSDIESEMEQRSVTLQSWSAGVRRFAAGLAKKVLLANTFGELCSVFLASGEKSVLFYWVYAIAFMLQIYFDFSGYSDMAIGLGRLFGFTFPENFNYPYLSRSITEFWRRWHMTLGGWFRDYVYIPLGGSRTDRRWKWLRNLAVVWLLTGLWHGASWNFVLWGAFFGVLLILEKLYWHAFLDRHPAFGHVYVLFIVIISFVIFNADGMSGVLADLGGLFGAGGLPLVTAQTLYYLRSYALALCFGAVGATPLMHRLWARAQHTRTMTFAEPLMVAAALLLTTACLVDGSFNPFLYFRF